MLKFVACKINKPAYISVNSVFLTKWQWPVNTQKDLANLQNDASWYVITLSAPNAMFMHINVA
jgi:hypothetical protein